MSDFDAAVQRFYTLIGSNADRVVGPIYNRKKHRVGAMRDLTHPLRVLVQTGKGTIREWLVLKLAFEHWLTPSNFDAQGRQRIALSQLTKEALAGVGSE